MYIYDYFYRHICFICIYIFAHMCIYIYLYIYIFMHIQSYTYYVFLLLTAFDDFCWCQKWVRPPFAVGKAWGCQTASLISILNEKLLHSVKLTAKATEKTVVVRRFSFELPYFKAPVSKGPSFWVSSR